ncbi:MAG: 50S ribosomal protein L21 [Bacteroidia bacterium]|nr:50S ribosomal protein L21 [Bacteroidia bacterium]MDW8157606.1 50S ribosomal protein L21 [Bacteroidia bacterium]
MFAIVKIGGHQYKLAPNQYVYVNRLPYEEGEKIQLEEVLMVVDNSNIKVGTPMVEGASVEAEVLQHLKDDKIIVFKKKRRKGYKVKKGHRQPLTKLQILSINT